MADPSIIGVDIDAIRDAVDALEDVGVQVVEVDTVDRDADDMVRWQMVCRAETRTADLGDFMERDSDG